MRQSPDSWDLVADGQDTLGVLTFREADQPWWVCDFEPAPIFERYSRFFKSQTAALEQDDFDQLKSHDERLISMNLCLRSRVNPALPDAAEMGIVDIDVRSSTAFFRPTLAYCQARAGENR